MPSVTSQQHPWEKQGESLQCLPGTSRGDGRWVRFVQDHRCLVRYRKGYRTSEMAWIVTSLASHCIDPLWRKGRVQEWKPLGLGGH